MPTLRLGTRKSALAQNQSRWVADQLRRAFPDLQIELILITTTGDQASTLVPGTTKQFKPSVVPGTTEQPGDLLSLAQTGGLKALFTKEIEEALLDRRIDLAVHSMKDMPADLPAGLALGAVPEREDPRDVWISKSKIRFKDIPSHAKIATGAVRRQAQLLHHRKDLILVPLRGNVDTRLRKLPDAPYDGMILALAGLKRLGLDKAATEILPINVMLPAIGQGALAIEIRSNDPHISRYVKALDHAPSRHAIIAERAFLHTLGGTCQTPIAAHATVSGDHLTISGLVVSPSGNPCYRASYEGPTARAADIGEHLAEQLLAQGARKILSGTP